MPFILALIALALPRFVAILIWLFSDWFSDAFDHWILPLLGFIFLPYSMLWYSAVMNWFGGTWGILQLIVMVFALALDIGSYKPRGRHH